MDKPKRFGEPTPLFDLMDKTPTFQKKVELFQRYKDDLSVGQRGLAGAVLVKCADEEGLHKGYHDIADVVGMNFLQIMMSMHVLRAGTPQEIKDVKDGHRGINLLYRNIIKRCPMPKDQRRYKGSNYRGRQVDRKRQQVDRSEMWHLLKAGLEGFTSLPLPSEVSAEIRKSRMMKIFTEERLDRAVNWIKDFADAYRAQQRAQEGGQAADQVEAGDDQPDPRSSGRAA